MKYSSHKKYNYNAKDYKFQRYPVQFFLISQTWAERNNAAGSLGGA